MATATWNGKIVAESSKTLLFDGNRYFPSESLKMEHFRPSTTETTCFWKGVASYYTIEVDGEKNLDAAWYYPTPTPQALQIKGYIAFWKGVKVVGP